MEQSIIKKTVNTLKGRSIFLIGMMGSGKSQTGLKLASFKPVCDLPEPIIPIKNMLLPFKVLTVFLIMDCSIKTKAYLKP